MFTAVVTEPPVSAATISRAWKAGAYRWPRPSMLQVGVTITFG